MQHLDDGTLQAWLDGARSGLSAAERIEIARHLGSCGSCAQRLEEMDALSRSVEALLATPAATEEPVPAFEAVRARAEQYHATGRRRSPWRSAAWAASIAAALGVGWMANGLHRGAVVPRMAADAAMSDSATATLATAAAELQPDTSSPGEVAVPASSAEQQVQVASKPVRDTASSGGVATSESSPARAVMAAAKQAVDSARPVDQARELKAAPVAPLVAGARRMSDAVRADESAPAPPALQNAAMAADLQVPSDSGPALVRGRVTDESGRPLSAAQVVVGGTGVGALTQQDGTFQFALDKLPADSASREVTLTAQLIGFRQVSHSLAVQRGKVVSTDFRLAPQPLALNEIVVTGTAAEARRERDAQAGIVVPPDDLFWGSWRTVSRADAEARAGFHVLVVPELPVTRIEVGSAEGATIVRVIQELDGGGSLELVESRSAVRFGQATSADGRVYAAMRQGEISVAAAAPLTAEALSALLKRLR